MRFSPSHHHTELDWTTERAYAFYLFDMCDTTGCTETTDSAGIGQKNVCTLFATDLFDRDLYWVECARAVTHCEFEEGEYRGGKRGPRILRDARTKESGRHA